MTKLTAFPKRSSHRSSSSCNFSSVQRPLWEVCPCVSYELVAALSGSLRVSATAGSVTERKPRLLSASARSGRPGSVCAGLKCEPCSRPTSGPCRDSKEKWNSWHRLGDSDLTEQEGNGNESCPKPSGLLSWVQKAYVSGYSNPFGDSFGCQFQAFRNFAIRGARRCAAGSTDGLSVWVRLGIDAAGSCKPETTGAVRETSSPRDGVRR